MTGLAQVGRARTGPVAAAMMFACCVDARAVTFPEIEIDRAQTLHEWPFAVDSGTLTCVELDGQRVVIFAEPWRTDVPQEFGNMTLPRSVVVSTNPFALLASLENSDLFLPFDDLETLVLRLAPFESMGKAVCDDDETDGDEP